VTSSQILDELKCLISQAFWYVRFDLFLMAVISGLSRKQLTGRLRNFSLTESVILEGLRSFSIIYGRRESVVQAKLSRKEVFHQMDRLYRALDIPQTVEHV
jgi:hypothetical protein